MSGSAGTLTYNVGGWPSEVRIGNNGGTGTLTVNAGRFVAATGNADICVATVNKDAQNTYSGSHGALSVGGGSVTCGRLIIADAHSAIGRP